MQKYVCDLSLVWALGCFVPSCPTHYTSQCWLVKSPQYTGGLTLCFWTHSYATAVSTADFCFCDNSRTFFQIFFNFTPPLQWSWKGGILVSPCPSVCPSVDRIVSALYLQQYLPDPLYICTSFQATSEGVSCEKIVSKFEIWQILYIHNLNFVFFWLGIQYESMVWVIMRRQGVSSECRHSICSSFWQDWWPWPIDYLIRLWSIFFGILTLNFQCQIWNLLLIQKWSDCHETKIKYIVYRLNSRPQIFTLALTLTLNFQVQIRNSLLLSQKWSDCHETKSKRIVWTLDLKFSH